MKIHDKIKKNVNIVVVGSGSWATAQISLLTQNVNKVGWYVRNGDAINKILETKHNPTYIKNLELDVDKIVMSDDINFLVKDADVIIIAVPSAFCQNVLAQISCDISNKFIVSTTKGIIPHEHLTLAEYVNENFKVPFSRICIISGPCHAEEIALKRLSYLTFASKKNEAAEYISKLYSTSFVIPVISNDIYGTEYGAILKNIYAVGVGICVGLGYGDNFMAVLVANSHREMKRFLNESYPAERNTSRSSYLGDLLVTCYSEFSRNRTFGKLIGEGYTPNEAIDKMKMIAEGYYAACGVFEINKQLNISMPIATAIYEILYNKKSAAKQMEHLTKELR